MIIRVHVLAHLLPRQRELLPLLVLPLTLDEVADRTGHSRRAIEDHWVRIRDRLNLPDAAGGSPRLSHVALVRVAYGIDPCFCERPRGALE